MSEDAQRSDVTSKHGGANVRLPPPLVFTGLIAIGFGLGFFTPPPLPAMPWLARLVAGPALAFAGVGLVLLAFGWFKRTGQKPAPWEPSPELIAQGIYRYTRNPMYVGMTCLQLGIGALAGNWWIVGLAPVALLVVHATAVVPEERYLAHRFGDSYEKYKRSVRRYL